MTAFIPAEWAPHRAMWVGWPSHAEYWFEALEQAQDEVEGLVRALAGPGREQVKLMVGKAEVLADAQARFAGVENVEVVAGEFGDIWLRDTAPILLNSEEARDFDFNGWGGKYDLEGDDTIGLRLGKSIGAKVGYCNWVLEGGAIDGDGAGTVVTTEQCLLNPNRNPTMTKADIERRLREDLGYTRVVWLGDGLLNDHTDGHVDNLARFVGEGRVALPKAAENDPNWQVFQHAERDARAAGLEVVLIPSPGRVLRDEEVVPASYMNFYIGNAAVVVPLYGSENDAAAVAAIQAIFPDREVVGLHADHILTGGGSFHCISQQIPA